VREFTDDHVRGAIAPLGYDDAMEVSRRIAEVGRQLAALDAEITVPGWYAGAGLEVVHQHVDPYGITVRARRAG
jgi:hypothetical protein